MSKNSSSSRNFWKNLTIKGRFLADLICFPYQHSIHIQIYSLLAWKAKLQLVWKLFHLRQNLSPLLGVGIPAESEEPLDSRICRVNKTCRRQNLQSQPLQELPYEEEQSQGYNRKTTCTLTNFSSINLFLFFVKYPKSPCE